MAKDILTSEYEMDIDSILADFGLDSDPALRNIHDADGDGEYSYGQEIDTDALYGEDELSYEEFVRLREAKDRAEAMEEKELSYEEFVRMREAQEAEEAEEAVKTWQPKKSRRQQMEEEARRFMDNYSAEDEDEDGDTAEDDSEDVQRRRDWEAQVREFYGTVDSSKGDSIEFDPRFNIGGQRESRIYRFDGQELDLSAEEGYVPARSREQISHWYKNEGMPVQEENTVKEKRRWGKKKKKEGFDETPVPPAEEQEGYDSGFHENYSAPNRRSNDEGYKFAEEEKIGGISINDTFPSFKEFYLGELMGIIYKIRFSALLADPAARLKDAEDKTEPDADLASRYYGGFMNLMKLKLKIALPLILLAVWLGLNLPIFGALKNLQVCAAMCLALQLTFMLLNLDIVTTGIINAFRLRFGADSLTVLACLVSSFDALSVMMDFGGSHHKPLVFISMLALYGQMLASYYSARGLRKSLRVSAIAELRYAVGTQPGRGSKYDTLIKNSRSHEGFVRRSEEMPPDEALFIKLSPFIVIVAALLSAAVCYVHDSWSELLYIFTLILSMGVPVSSLLCFALPFCIGSFKIFKQGSAIAGWSGVCDIGDSERLIINDKDLFPGKCVALKNITLAKNVNRRDALSYAGTILFTADTCTTPAVMELMEKNNRHYANKPGGEYKQCKLLPMENFEVLAGGGFKAVIDGSVVLLGGMDLMKLMNVKLMHREMGSRDILLAVNGRLIASFEMVYTPDPEVRKALKDLMRSDAHPIFAMRDFNITPAMLRDLFDLATDGYDFPPYTVRFDITKTEQAADGPITAVICREGLKPLVATVETGKSIYSAAKTNMLVSALSAVLGMAIVFLKLLVSGSIGAGFLLAFAVLFAVPVLVLSIGVKL